MSGKALSPARVRAALADPRGARVERVVIGGDVYHPVLFADRTYADHETLRAWANQDDPARTGMPPRRLRFVVADESELVGSHPGWRIDVRSIRFDQGANVEAFGGVPLAFCDSGLVIGVAESITLEPPGTVPQTEGDTLVASARIFDTVLASIAFDAITRRVFDGACVALCPETKDTEARVFRGGHAGAINVGDLASSCCRNARVLGWTAEEKV